MCGIAGFLSFNTNISLDVLRKMTDSLSHRGPDGDGHWINQSGAAGFGHRRLAIIDLTDDGKQPMHYLDGRYTITFNGEIYNYIEIKENLTKKGYKFQSQSDTEVLLALFHDKKEACLEDIDGMFAFAIWDEKEQRLFCARDRFGEKPFYYAVYNNSLYFASEMKALWAAGIPKELNSGMLYNYLAHNVVYNPKDLSETFYTNIFKLKAAHYFYLTPQNLEPDAKKYWDIDYTRVNNEITEEAAAETFRELFYESVGRRLRSDVAVGSSLSGGLDSSLVVCVIDELQKNSNSPQLTFSARFPGFARDEGKFMQMVIDRTNVEPHFVYPDEEGLISNFEKLCHHQEEPFGSASIYAQYCVMQSAKENNVTVLLDGQGADELLAGYHFYFAHYLRGLKVQDKHLWREEGKSYQSFYGNSAGQSALRKTVAQLAPEWVKTTTRKLKQNLMSDTPVFLNKDFEQEYKNFSAPDEKQFNSLRESLYHSTFNGALEELLRYADRNSMAHSREVRLPFLSPQLAEFLFSLPEKYKIRNATTKYIMRRAFAGILPAEILNRRDKIGYEPPQQKWLENESIKEKLESSIQELIKLHLLDNNVPASTQTAAGNLNSSLAWRVLMTDYLLEK